MDMHPLETRQRAITLLRDGATNADVARALKVPVGTIGAWKHKDRATRGECPGAHHSTCPRCDGQPMDSAAYAYLLGQYLGDGSISHYSGHRVPTLRITCADSWPGVSRETAAVLLRVFPHNQIGRVRKAGCHDLKVVSKHLYCLFPQHGPGMKHTRKIALAHWQQEIVDAHPWEFIRGLIHSDGCRITNWTTRVVAGERKRYEYPRYFFTNKSDCIRELYTDTLDKLGVTWTHCTRHGNPYNISVARKQDVALLDVHIGPKY
ncbi:helix-turn-helix domain-containing protein [Streptomyces endophyticus]|uniref:Helix-turn-helix domain-containing protein n=1 Tax=Streptomyces endophyticus TaxID=714166 RepID=A0ABU6F632_9ACTN|nr:helix-turn-helix domain-containing protein [Streptomyces endophyticus]MEB8339476.1 helix-turn-helix domain-containing protein [Streptomyces endophyticus]